MRADPPLVAGVHYERSDGVLRALGSHNYIVSWHFDAVNAGAIVAREAARFRHLGLPVEWKVYGHDSPPTLTAALEANGFVPDESETLMIRDIHREPQSVSAHWPAGIDVLEVRDEARLADLVTLSARAFDCEMPTMFADLSTLLFARDARTKAYVAYAKGEPIAGGRLEMPRDRSFASLWDGATVAGARRQGVFSSLVALRCDVARENGYRYVTVDARETSRPILERLGFVALTTIVGWLLP